MTTVLELEELTWREITLFATTLQKNNNTNGKYVAGCQKRLKANRAGDQKKEKK